MQENCGETEYFGGSVILTEIPKKAASHIRDMIYDDALSGWGHRDSLLDPANNYVDIGVDWDSDRVVLVVHMIGKHVEWKSPPKVENMVFSASGVLDKDVKFYGIGVYYHPPPEKVTNPTLRHSYELGSQIAGVVPSPYYYEDIATWRPIRWSISSSQFDVSFKINPIKGPGFYTVVIFVENKSGLKHPYDPERSDHWSILEYSILVK